MKELYSYIFEVKDSTERIINRLTYAELRKKIPEERKEYLKSLNVVSDDKNAIWLIDYWCGKDIRALIQMPFSRHWIMHIEAGLRIKNKTIFRKIRNADISNGFYNSLQQEEKVWNG